MEGDKITYSIFLSILYYIYEIGKIGNQIIFYSNVIMNKCAVFRDSSNIQFNYLRFLNCIKSNKIKNQKR